MNDDELINELSSYGGMDKQLLAMPEYLQMYLNIIRNDYKLIESFAGAEQKTVKAKFRLYSGTDDSLIKENDMVEWESLTSSSTTKRVFEGGHFFIKQYYKDICNDIIENT
jgi:surfactin synthase thioesterase subunit